MKPLGRLRASRGVDVHLRSGPQMAQYRAIARRLAHEQRGPVLDWGSGFGQVAKLLAEEGVDVTLFEYRPDLEPGLRRLELYPELSAHSSPDPVRLPFEDASFDAVLSCGVLEHVKDPDGSVGEIRRILKPSGTFYIYNLPNRYSYLERIARTLGLYYHGQLPEDRVYTRKTATALLERHGFRVRECRRANMLPLTLPGSLADRLAVTILWISRTFAQVPGLNLVATSLELVAEAPP